MDGSTTMNDYSSLSYWDSRFAVERRYDWFGDLSVFNCCLNYINCGDRILHLGCGTSQLSMQLHARGYHRITNLDYSQSLIDQLVAEHVQTAPSMNWVCQDIRTLDFPSDSFDVIIEKGTLDALLVAEKDVWNITGESKRTIRSILDGIKHFLSSKSGKFISISFAQPHFRLPLLLPDPGECCSVDDFNFKITVEKVTNGLEYFVYILEKTDENMLDWNEALAKKFLYPILNSIQSKFVPISCEEKKDDELFLKFIEV